jgi:S-adenosylmethionine synthetase
MLRKDGRCRGCVPDAKSQVTIRYVDGKPHAIDTVVLSTQHAPDMSLEDEGIAEAVIEDIIKPVLPAELIKGEIKYLVNPTGRFVIGGPQGDCGLTGRKIIVDTYGGAAPHGGGAFSGKDPSKVDRSAPTPPATSRRTSSPPDLRRSAWCRSPTPSASPSRPRCGHHLRHRQDFQRKDDRTGEAHFDLRPKGIVQMLDLLRPIYQKTAAYGHFGRDEPEFTWEAIDKAAALRADAGL